MKAFSPFRQKPEKQIKRVKKPYHYTNLRFSLISWKLSTNPNYSTAHKIKRAVNNAHTGKIPDQTRELNKAQKRKEVRKLLHSDLAQDWIRKDNW